MSWWRAAKWSGPASRSASVLGEDDIGREIAQTLGAHAVDREPVTHQRLDALIDLGAGAIGTVNAGLDRPRERGVAEPKLAPPARARARIEDRHGARISARAGCPSRALAPILLGVTTVKSLRPTRRAAPRTFSFTRPSASSSRPSSPEPASSTTPCFVEREFRAYLECGVLAHGFLRLHCDACGCDRLLPFSCKGRFCPSCGGRRMADTAAHLVDRVLPEVPVRQWVLSLPFALRYRLAYDAPLTSEVLNLFLRTLFASLRRRARKQWGVRRAQCGAVTFVQRFGSAAANLNVHFHSLVLDGVYEVTGAGPTRFHPLPPPDDGEVARVVVATARRLAPQEP